MPDYSHCRKLALLAACALAAAALQAQPPAQPASNRIVVIGSRLGTDDFEAGNVIVCDRQDIDRIVPGDTEQLLDRMPGVSIFRPGGPGGVSEVFVRGGESNFTAVYVDGVRLNNSTNTRGGSFDFSTLPAFSIERIELAPSAMSAIYGSDTMAGVIRIETAWPEPGDVQARAEVGSENDWRAGLGSSFAFGNGGLELGLIGTLGDAGDEVPGSTLETRELGAKLAIGSGDTGAWTLIARFAERDRTSFPEVSGGPLYAALDELESSTAEQASLSASAGWRFSDAWTAELVISRADLSEDFRSPPIVPGVLDGQPAFSTQTNFERTEALFVNRYRFSESLHAAFGLNLVMEDGRDNGTIDLGGPIPAAYTLERDIRSAFAEIGRTFGSGFAASIAIRADNTSSEDEVSGKLNLSKRFAGLDGRVWATAATGFKLPSFFALGNPLYGNPDLESETVESLEIGFEQQAGARFGYSLSVFANAYEDLIDFDFESFTSVNRASVDIEGVQGSLSVAVNDSLTLSLDATALSIETGVGGSTLPRRPEEIATITVDRRLGQDWSVRGSVRYVGSRTISSIPTGIIEDGSYQLADITFRKHADDGLSWWIAVDNLFDAEYMLAPGFPAPGAHLRLGTEVVY